MLNASEVENFGEVVSSASPIWRFVEGVKRPSLTQSLKHCIWYTAFLRTSECERILHTYALKKCIAQKCSLLAC